MQKMLFFWLIALPFSIWAQPAQEGPPDTEAEFKKAYEERIKKDRLSGIYIPKNLDDAMLQLDKLITPESQEKIRRAPEDTICYLLHNRLGQWMIINWGFTGGSRLSHYLRSAGVTFPDDMADFLILAYHRKLNNKPYAIKDLAKNFKEKRSSEFKKEIESGEVIKVEKRTKPKPPGSGN